MFDGIGKRRMGQPVRRPGFLRQKAARHFVLALGAAFEGGDFLRDTKFQRLIISGFEMQARDMLEGTPVAPEQRVLCVNEQGSGDFAVVKAAPQAAIVNPSPPRPGTSTGVEVLSRRASPSWPDWFHPQV